MNKVLLACVVIALVSPAFAREYKHSGCRDAAEMKFPTDRIAPADGSITGLTPLESRSPPPCLGDDRPPAGDRMRRRSVFNRMA